MTEDESKAASPDLFPRPPRIIPSAMVWDKDLECLVPKYGRNHFAIEEKRSDLPSPAIRPDGMPRIKSMTDGRYYDGKSAYYREVSRKGCEIVGHDKRWMEHVKDPLKFGGEKAHEAAVVSDVKKAIEIEQSKVPSYGPEARQLMRKEKRKKRETTC